MSTFRARFKTFNIRFLAKFMILPIVAGAVVGAESLNRVIHSKPQADDEQSLNETFRSHFIRLGEGNTFGGTITGIDERSSATVGIGGLNVYLVQQSQIIREGTTNDRGSFEMKGIDPGTYSFCVAGKNGFLAYGVHMVEPAEESDEAVDVDLNQEAFEVQTTWTTHAPLQVTAAVVPPEFRALRQIMSDLLPYSVAGSVGSGGDDVRINVEKSIVAGGYKIRLGSDGTLKGRLAPVATQKGEPIRMQDMNVFLIQDDEVYARGNVEEDGQFEMQDVEPGVYGFAAAGKDGFAALSFQAIEPSEDEIDASLQSEDGDTFASSGAAFDSSVLEVAICPPEDSAFLKSKIDELVDDRAPFDPGPPLDGPPAFGPGPEGMVPGDFGSPFNPGGGGGGFGPGGGFSGPGGNRLFRLAVIGGIIWGIVEIAGDDDPVSTPDPVSPSG